MSKTYGNIVRCCVSIVFFLEELGSKGQLSKNVKDSGKKMLTGKVRGKSSNLWESATRHLAKQSVIADPRQKLNS